MGEYPGELKISHGLTNYQDRILFGASAVIIALNPLLIRWWSEYEWKIVLNMHNFGPFCKRVTIGH